MNLADVSDSDIHQPRGRRQGGISNRDSNGFIVRQGRYAVLNGFVAWGFLPKVTLRFTVNSIGNEKDISTLRHSGYYGALRNYMLSLSWRF